MDVTAQSVTRLLNAAADGDRVSADELLRLLYEELRGMARARMRARHGAALDPTELVHEAYLRLFDRAAAWNSRGHFFAAAAQAMRNVLVDQARERASLKRGGKARAVDAHEPFAVEAPTEDVLTLHELLEELERGDPRKASVVLMHCFGGLDLAETAAALGVSLSTVEREWRFARALLRSRLAEPGGGAAS